VHRARDRTKLFQRKLFGLSHHTVVTRADEQPKLLNPQWQ
jgi:hypothetical protein